MSRAGLAGGAKSSVVETTRSSELDLIAPEDMFYPLPVYIRKFNMDPKSKKDFKKTGHKVSIINGMKGVLVPASDPDGAWRVQRRLGSKIARADTHDTDEADEEVVEKKYSDLLDEQAAALAANCVGIAAALLAKVANLEEERPSQPAPAVAKKKARFARPVAAVAGHSGPAKRRGAIVSDCSSDAPPPGEPPKKGQRAAASDEAEVALPPLCAAPAVSAASTAKQGPARGTAGAANH